LEIVAWDNTALTASWNGKVGIGTILPEAKLYVRVAATSTEGILEVATDTHSAALIPSLGQGYSNPIA
jgi:hypothetical protein